MGSYTIQGSDGKSYTIESPEKVSESPKKPFNPLGDAMDIMKQGALRTIANPSDMRNITSGIGQTFGYNVKGAALDKMLPKNPKTASLINELTDPTNLMMGMTASESIPFKGISLAERAQKLPFTKMLASEEGQSAKISKEMPKAITATEQLLKPSDKEFARSIEKGVQYNPSEQAAKYISPAKNYTELTDQMRLAEGMPMEARSKVYSSTKANPSDSHLNSLDDLIGKERSVTDNPQVGSPASNAKLRNYEAVRDAEKRTFDSISPEELKDPNFWQKRKAYYQQQADNAGAYTGNEKMSARAEAYRALAQEAQNKTYALDDAVLGLNLENAGIGTAKKRFSELAQVERGQPPPSVSKEVTQSIRPSGAGTMAALFRKLTGEGYTDVPKLTKTISKSMSKVEKAQALIDLISEMKKPEKVAFSMDEPLQLSAPTPKGLPSPDDFRSRDIKAGKFLSGGQGSGKPIRMGDRGRYGSGQINLGDTPDYPRTGNLPATGQEPLQPRKPSQIELPEYTQSDIEALSKKWGVPERNIREIINASDIEPVVKSSSTEGLVMSKKRRAEINQIMARRKANFK